MIYLFKIGEFSKLTQVSVRMLRYYDSSNILKPAYTDKYTGYRLYSTEQIPIVNQITFLRDTGFSVAEISQIIENWDSSYLIEKLSLKHNEIENNIMSEQEKLIKIQNLIKNISLDKKETDFNISLKSVPSYAVLSNRKIVSNYFEEGLLWDELTSYIIQNGIKVTPEINFAIYHDLDYKDKDIDIEVCSTVDKLAENENNFIYRHTEKIELMASTMVYGPYENIKKAYFSFAEWLSCHKIYSMSNEPNRQICHIGPWNEDNPENFLTEIQIPIIKNNP